MEPSATRPRPPAERGVLLTRLRRLKVAGLAVSLIGFLALIGLGASTDAGGSSSTSTTEATAQPQAASPSAADDGADDAGSDWGATQVSPAPSAQAPAASSGAS
jgi:hypothetical protein